MEVADGRITHVIRRGETLSSISRRYGTTVAAVQEWNGLRGSAIRAGQRLSILTTGTATPPAAASTAASRGAQVTHVVRRGETLSSISRRHGTTVAAVQGWNGLRGSAIRAGQRLSILTTGTATPPAAPSTAASRGAQVTHVVRRGETLSSISRRYGTTVAAVQGWNGLRGRRAALHGTTVAAVQGWNRLRGSVIRVGQRLTLFAAGPTPPSTAASRGRRVTHVIRRGETLSSISRRYGTTVAAVQDWNGLRGSVIRAGRRLTIFTTRPGGRRTTRNQPELRFRLDDNGVEVPDVRAEAAIIYNPSTGQVLWEENSQNQRSIASITKVMTAVVFLENSPDLSQEVVVKRADVRRASVTYLRAGYKVTAGNLLHLLLIASDNAAARVLARVSPHGSTGFIECMNQKAAELGLTDTHYADTSGLLAANISSAYDMARLMAYAGGDSRIADLMQKQRYDVPVGRRTISIRNTNRLVMKGDVDVLGGKTGFIRKAGYCLATLLRLPQGGPPVVVVVLGARSSASRFAEARQLVNWLASRAQDLLAVPVQAAAVANGS